MEIEDEVVDLNNMELSIDIIQPDPAAHTLRLTIPVALELDVIENFQKNDPLVKIVVSDEPTGA